MASNCLTCGKVGISRVSNDLTRPKYPVYNENKPKKNKKTQKSSLEKDGSDFNLGHDVYTSDPDEASEEIIKRDFIQIYNREKEPHDVIFIPDPFNFGTIAPKVVVSLAGQETFSPEKRNELKKYDNTLKGAEEEFLIYKKLREVLTGTTKNAVVFNGWKDNGKNNTEMREYDFIIVSEQLKTIIQIEAKTTKTNATCKSAADQLESGMNFFKSKVPLPREENWTYTRVMCFGNSKENPDESNSICSKCSMFVLFTTDDFNAWWLKIEESLTTPSNGFETTKGYEGILKFLFFQMLQQGDPLTETQQIQNTEKIINDTSTIKNVFFWSNTQYHLMNDGHLNRVAFTSSFGTGKTFLLKAKGKELLRKKEKVVFVILSDSERMLLKQTYEEEFKHFKNAKVIAVLTKTGQKSPVEFLGSLIKENPECNFFMDEVDNGVVNAKALLQMSKQIDPNCLLWIAYQSQTPPTTTILKQEFYLPEMNIPLRYSGNILKTCEAHKTNVRGSRWPTKDSMSKTLLNVGNRSTILSMKPETSCVHAVLHVAEILHHLVVRTIIKIDFDDNDIIEELQKTSIKERLVLENKSEDFVKFPNKILIVTSKSDKFVKGIEVPLLVVFSNNQTREMTEDIFSRCISKLIVVCDEENATKFELPGEKDDFAQILPVEENFMPEILEASIKNNNMEEFRNPIFVYRRPLSINIKNSSGQTPLMLICSQGKEEMGEEALSNDEIDINAIDQNDWTALHYAAKSRSLGLTQLLLQYGADTKAVTNKNETAIKIASSRFYFEVAKLIQDYEYNIKKIQLVYTKTEIHFQEEDRKERKKYFGKVQNDLPCGIGTMTYKDGSTFEGEWLDGVQNGYGIFYYSKDDAYNRLSYEGSWENDKRSGFGTLIWKDGAKYDGDWLNDLRHGKGKQIYSNESHLLSYEGDWLEDKVSGNGILMLKNGQKYDGNWLNDLRHGKGKEIYSDESDQLSYEGDWDEGKWSGKGVLMWKDGEKYDGEWLNDLYHGKGKLIYGNESHLLSYEGDRIEGKRSGKGVLIWKDGQKYDGEWLNDLYHGKGKLIYANESDQLSYEGDWVEDKITGKGVLIWKDGTKYVGQFKDYEFHGSGTQTSASGEVLQQGQWENGRYIG